MNLFGTWKIYCIYGNLPHAAARWIRSSRFLSWESAITHSMTVIQFYRPGLSFYWNNFCTGHIVSKSAAILWPVAPLMWQLCCKNDEWPKTHKICIFWLNKAAKFSICKIARILYLGNIWKGEVDVKNIKASSLEECFAGNGTKQPKHWA